MVNVDADIVRTPLTPVASLEANTFAVRNNNSLIDTLDSKLGVELPSFLARKIDFNKWNQLYPYALSIYEELSNGGYNRVATFALPIPPEQLTIQAPFAIETTKTLRGIVEEHSGAPFRIIAFTGTTGVYPMRYTSTTKNDSIIGGVVQSFQSTVAAAKSLFGVDTPSTGDVSEEIKGTGYGQFRLLEYFLFSYAEAKRQGRQNLRLVFRTFKDEKEYLVTPMQFTLRREAGRALKYRYDLQLKAWKVLPVNWTGTDNAQSMLPKSNYAKMIEVINKTRKLVAAATSTVKAVRAAVTRLLDVVRQVALAIKEIAGFIKAIVDLPRQIIMDCKKAFIESWNMIKDSVQDLGLTFDQFGADMKRMGRQIDKYSSKFGKWAGGSASTTNNGTSGGRPSTRTSEGGAEGWTDQIFDDPNSPTAIEVFSRIDVSKLKTSPALTKAIQAEYTKASKMTKDEYAALRNEVRSIAVQLSDGLGASSSSYDLVYNNTHNTITRTPTQADWDLLFGVNDFLGVLNDLSGQTSNRLTTIDYVAGLANKSGVAFRVPTSKFAVPFPFDHTLEELARTYLGDPDRWMEIATLNGLREPYVDEVGFNYQILGNGKLSEINVASSTNLAINQAVWLQSNTVNREKRHILNITVVGPGNVILTLDGEADLDKYVAADNPYMQAFLPDTVNSQQMIYIPSDAPASPQNEALRAIPGVDAFDSLLDVGGVDMLLTSDNDLAITPDGDCRMAYGMSNIVQHARVALSTPQGTLIRHPTFGLPVKVGSSVADLDIGSLKNAVSDMFTSDPAFEGTSSVAINQQGGVLQIGVGLQVKGHDYPLSVAFQVRR